METTVKEKGIYCLNLKAYGIRLVPPRSLYTLWNEVEDDICLNSICCFNDDNAIDKYANCLRETQDYVLPFTFAETENHRIIPRGAVTLSWLAKNRMENHINTLIHAGAVPDRVHTMLEYDGDKIWEYLEDIYRSIQGRKFLKPASTKEEV
jgi:hypothetical protein